MQLPVLKDIGLTDSESKVYFALLELGDATRGNIVTRSGIAGSKVYDILEKLQEKGLVAIYSQNKIKHFKPTHPTQIITYLEEKKQRISDVETQVKSVLPMLLSMYDSSKEEQEVELLTGLKGLEIIFREQVLIMGRGETCYVIGGTRGTDETDVMAFFQKIHVMRAEKGIKTRMLYNLRQKEMASKVFSGYEYTTVKYIPHTSPVAINVYKNRTVIIIFGKRITTVHIKSEDVAKSFREYFELLWESA
jgi:predicted transcriptional regulator